jgi:hypothetical protein
MNPWEVAQRMSLREFVAMCSQIDANGHNGQKFEVLKVERTEELGLEVTVLYTDHKIEHVKVA